VNAQTEHCRRCNTEIQPKHDSDVDKLQQQLRDLLLTDKVEKVDVTEQRSLLQDFLEDDADDEDEYFDDEQDQFPNQQEEQNNNEHINGSIDDQQEEQNNNEHIYDSVDDQSDDENQQGRPIFFRNYYDPIDFIDNQVQPYIPQLFFRKRNGSHSTSSKCLATSSKPTSRNLRVRTWTIKRTDSKERNTKLHRRNRRKISNRRMVQNSRKNSEKCRMKRCTKTSFLSRTNCQIRGKF
jgi:hypothetical protein